MEAKAKVIKVVAEDDEPQSPEVAKGISKLGDVLSAALVPPDPIKPNIPEQKTPVQSRS